MVLGWYPDFNGLIAAKADIMCAVILHSHFLGFPATVKPYAWCTLCWKTWFTQCCCFQKIWQRHVPSSWGDHLSSLEVGGVSVAHCEINADGKFMPLPGGFWWAALVNSRKMDQQGAGEAALQPVQTLCKVLLVEDLEKIAFGLWGCIQSAAWTPPVWQVRHPRENPLMTQIFVFFMGCKFAWIRTPFVLRSFSSKCTERLFSWCLLSTDQFCRRGTRDLNACTQTEMKYLGERSHSSQRKICPECKLLMLCAALMCPWHADP